MKTVYSADELMFLLSIWQGRKFIFELLNRSGMFASPFAQDRALLEYNCGAHAIGVELLNDCMTISPKLAARMLEEQGQYDNDRATEQQRSADNSGDTDLPVAFDRTNGFGG